VEADVELMPIPIDAWMKVPINVAGACVCVRLCWMEREEDKILMIKIGVRERTREGSSNEKLMC